MRVLGVDPALTQTGYSIVDKCQNDKFKLIEAGIIRTVSKDTLDKRLLSLHNALYNIIEEFKPQVLVLEKLYSHYKHPATSILMGHARGVACFLCAQTKLDLIDLSATRIKKSITGNGHASKLQVQRMVAHMFNLGDKKYPLDATDAIALAAGYLNINSKRMSFA